MIGSSFQAAQRNTREKWIPLAIPDMGVKSIAPVRAVTIGGCDWICGAHVLIRALPGAGHLSESIWMVIIGTISETPPNAWSDILLIDAPGQ
jgi:hypothetical protein